MSKIEFYRFYQVHIGNKNYKKRNKNAAFSQIL